MDIADFINIAELLDSAHSEECVIQLLNNDIREQLGFENSRYFDVLYSVATGSRLLKLRAWGPQNLPGCVVGYKVYDGPFRFESYEDGKPLVISTDVDGYGKSVSERIAKFSTKMATNCFVAICTRDLVYGVWSLEASVWSPRDGELDLIRAIARAAAQRINELRNSRLIDVLSKVEQNAFHRQIDSSAILQFLTVIAESISASVVTLFIYDAVSDSVLKWKELLRDGNSFRVCDIKEHKSDYRRLMRDATANEAFHVDDYEVFSDRYEEYLEGSDARQLSSIVKAPIRAIMFCAMQIPGGPNCLVRSINRYDQPQLSFTTAHSEMLKRITVSMASFIAVDFARHRLRGLEDAFSGSFSLLQKQQGDSQSQLVPGHVFAPIARVLKESHFPFLIVINRSARGRINFFWCSDRFVLVSERERETLEWPDFSDVNPFRAITKADTGFLELLFTRGLRCIYIAAIQSAQQPQDSSSRTFAIIPLSFSGATERTAEVIGYWQRRPNITSFLDVCGTLVALVHSFDENKHLLSSAREAVGFIAHEVNGPITEIQKLSEYLILRTRYLLEDLKIPHDSHEYLSEKSKYRSVDDFKYFLREIEVELLQTGQYASGVVSNSLNFGRLGANVLEIEFQSIDLYRLMRRCSKLIEQNERADVHFSFNEAAQKMTRYVGEPTYLEVLFRNLFDNASKYTHRRGDGAKTQVKVQVSAQDNFIDIFVINWGLGIPDNEFESIFQGFYRASVRDSVRKVRGVGLGLAACRRIARMHRGDIVVKSVPTLNDPVRIANYEGFETTFRVRLSRQLREGRHDV